MENHCFIVCAYKESPYLEKCIRSLKRQEIPSKILMCTSTPNEYISALAEKYKIPLIINPQEGDIQSDWNFAYNTSREQFVTLVHQDDLYRSSYTKFLFRAIRRYDDISIFFSNYRALVTTDKVEKPVNDVNCFIRNVLCIPMLVPCLQDKKWWKQAILRFGNSICCSSVTYNKALLGKKDVFRSELRYSLDWDSYWRMASLPGRFYYDRHVLNFFRIHQLSTSMQCIDNHSREKEDHIMFCKIWPKWFAKVMMRFYRLAYCNYRKLKKG